MGSASAERAVQTATAEADTEPSSSWEGTRMEVCPPSLFPQDALAPRSRFGAWLPTLSDLRDWLSGGSLQPTAAGHAKAAAPPEPPSVRAARQAFVAALADLPPHRVGSLPERAHTAGTLRELWHLRNELFTLVSIEHCEAVAHDRLAVLNRFFPVRAQGGAPRRDWPFAASAHHDVTAGLER